MPLGNPIRKQNESRMVSVLATEGQTVFTVQGGYIINHISVFRNGVRLSPAEDFTAGDGSTVTLNNAANVEDRIDFHIFDRFTVQNAIIGAASTQTINGDLVLNGKLFGALDVPSINLTGIVTATELDLNGKGDISSDLNVGGATTTGRLTVTANTVLGNSSGDSVTITGDLDLNGQLDVSGISTFQAIQGTTGTFSGAVSGTTGTFSGDVSIAENIVHTGDTDTRIRFSGANEIKLEVAGVERFMTSASETVINDPGSDVDFRIEGDTDANLLYVNAGLEAIGIGSAIPRSGYKLDVNGDLSLGESNGTANTFIEQKQDGDLHIINSGRTQDGSTTTSAGGVGINRYNTVAGGTTRFRDFTVYDGKDTKVFAVDGSTKAVGVGSDLPSQRLQVAGDSGDACLSLLRTNAASNDNAWGHVFFENMEDVTLGSISCRRQSAAADAYIHFHTTKDGGSLTERMRITAAGNINQTINEDAIGFNQTAAGNHYIKNVINADRTGANAAILALHAQWNSKDVGAIKFRTGTDTSNKDDGVICFETSSSNNISEHIRIDSNGKLLVNHTSARQIAGGNSLIQVESNDSTGRISIVQNRNEASGAPFLSLGKSRGTAVGGTTVVQDGDTVGTIAFAGSDGTDFPSVAQIVGQVDGTPGNNDMPGRLTFRTCPDGTDSSVERMRINKDGNVFILGKNATADYTLATSKCPLYLRTSTNITAVSTSEGDTQDGMFTIEDTAASDRFHGIQIRNRSGGDIRILNHDRNTNNAGDLVIAQYSAAANVGVKEKIRLSSVYDSIQIAGKGGASLAGLGENVQKTDIYICTQSNLTTATENAGSEISGIIRFHETGGSNNRFHGIELRNRNSGDVRILNQATTASNFASMIFVTDDGSATTQRMIINGNGNVGAPSGNNIFNASDERLKENMIELTDGLNKINQIKPVSFTWKEGWDPDLDGLTQYGFGAHQVKSVDEILVESFGEKEITLNGETIDNPLRVNEKHVIPLLVKAIQELSAKVAALEG